MKKKIIYRGFALFCLFVFLSICAGCNNSCQSTETPEATNTVEPQIDELTESPIQELPVTGILLDNVFQADNDNCIEHSSDPSELSSAYLNQISYRINSLDKESGLATVTVSIPDIESILSTVIDSVQKDNPNTDYESLLKEAEGRLAVILNAGEVEMLSQEVSLHIIEHEGKMLFEASDDLSELLVGSIEKAFINIIIQQWEVGNESIN